MMKKLYIVYFADSSEQAGEIITSTSKREAIKNYIEIRKLKGLKTYTAKSYKAKEIL